MSEAMNNPEESHFWSMAHRLGEIAEIAFEDDEGEDGESPKPETIEFWELRDTVLKSPAVTCDDMSAKVYALQESGSIGWDAPSDNAIEQYLIAERRLDTIYDAVRILKRIIEDLEAGRPVTMVLDPEISV